MIFYIAQDEEGRRHLKGTQADAREVNKTFEQVDIPTDKAGLLTYIQNLFSQIDTKPHPVEADVERVETVEQAMAVLNEPEPEPEPEPAKVSQSYSERSVEIDEIFHNLPLGHQLSLAQIALENARWTIKPPVGGVLSPTLSA